MNHMSNYLKNKVLTENLRTTPVDGQTSNNADVLFPIASEARIHRPHWHL